MKTIMKHGKAVVAILIMLFIYTGAKSQCVPPCDFNFGWSNTTGCTVEFDLWDKCSNGNLMLSGTKAAFPPGSSTYTGSCNYISDVCGYACPVGLDLSWVNNTPMIDKNSFAGGGVTYDFPHANFPSIQAMGCCPGSTGFRIRISGGMLYMECY